MKRTARPKKRPKPSSAPPAVELKAHVDQTCDGRICWYCEQDRAAYKHFIVMQANA
jgi:hypothetical protein